MSNREIYISLPRKVYIELRNGFQLELGEEWHSLDISDLSLAILYL